jgi:hypothetical protein
VAQAPGMSTASRLDAWPPPPRPDWVSRINAEGRHLDIRDLVPLDSRSLRETAERATGLSDYGDDAWREPFEIIVRSLDEEADLNLMGRLMSRSDLLHYLEGRLRIEDTYRRHPEIDDEQIVKPFVVVGQGRSGTSMLLNVMSRDPGNGSVKTWEAIFPCPPPQAETYACDPRIERGDALITQWNRVNPDLTTLHEFGGTVPASCVHFMSYSFMSIWFNMLGQVPSYSQWCASADWNVAFGYHKRLLKLLQWRNPREHWVLKSPTHLAMMPIILQTYPDACFIWPHRDPLKAIVSSIDLAGNLIWARSDNNRMLGFEDYNKPDRTLAMLERPIEWLESGVLPRARLCNVAYLDLIKDPVGTVASIYDHFGVELTPAARRSMQDYLAEHPRSSRNAHLYDEDAIQSIRCERALFARYQDYFQVPSEI